VTLVKVCGIRSVADGRAALQAGADLLGFIFWTPGKRFIRPIEAAQVIAELRGESLKWSAVGVFVDPSLADVTSAVAQCSLDYVQLSGNEPPELVRGMPRPTLKAVHVRTGSENAAAEAILEDRYGAAMYLLDTHAEALPGGTGVAFDWQALQPIGPRCIVAGGLRPENVTRALETLQPLGVDVSSGVELSTGGKDPELVRQFVEAVHRYDCRVS
jgi:phosphoribosylanthranilate isomerase